MRDVWWIGRVAALVAALLSGTPSLAGAEEEGAAEAEPVAQAVDSEAVPGPEASPGAADARPPVVRVELPARVARLGRLEAILLQNDDPESAIELAREVEAEHGEDGQLHLLTGAALMRLRRPAEAAQRFERATALAESDPVLRLHALYNLGRSLSLAGQLAPAAEAYERYAAHARANPELPSFIEYAERSAATLRARAEAASSRPAAPARRRAR